MIYVEDVSKIFKLYRHPGYRLKEVFFKKQYHKKFTALNRISLTVNNGETVGIIGRNGAGKSTLLKLLTGVMIPESGTIKIDGKITGLLELGTGFNPEFTGRENIFLNSTYAGLTREEVEFRLDDIINFSELGQYIDEPLKTYSSGMAMRLAFATAIHAEPDAFVVDEALSVGDASFQQKCIARIKEFKDKGGAIVFVSHDLNAVKVLCDRAIMLERGTVVEEGDPEQVINAYNRSLSKQTDSASAGDETRQNCYGNMKVVIEKLQLLDEDGKEIKVIVSRQKIKIKFYLAIREDIGDITLGILIRDRFGQDIYGTNSNHLGKKIKGISGERKIVEFMIDDFFLGAGKYTLTAAVHTEATHIDQCYHWIDHACSFAVVMNADTIFSGICDMQAQLKICGKVT